MVLYRCAMLKISAKIKMLNYVCHMLYAQKLGKIERLQDWVE